ncbi:S8 family serine peptidase, partial [Polaribacter sp.]|nr:S8 family serine peptidase [Polaribacter sp.]
SRSGKARSDFKIGELLGVADKLSSSKVMFHKKAIEQSILNKETTRARNMAKALANPNNGFVPQEPMSMKNVFVLKTIDTQENILQLIQQIKDNPNVEYAEPNYIYGIDDFEVGDIITAEEASKLEANTLVDVDDPLYSSQSNITTTNIDDVWDQYTTGDGSQVIAILDTGVDYTHPDLEANIWINTLELNGVEGYDDDGNGYIDDIRGWDFINIDNAPLDDNMHGTHVAGIAGAVGNNGIGIAGAAWNVKLMPIKVFQSSGQGNLLTIAEGVEYASSNGATIINMSFGSYVESYTLSLALENAYSTAILVAAAGNDSRCLDPENGCSGYPYFPAAYNYVLGVKSPPFPPYGFSNYDSTGPIATSYSTLLNYELYAPGVGIMSTIPNGGYTTLTGTSMSAPLVAGALALYAELKPEDSKELMFGSLIRFGDDNVVTTLQIVDFLHTVEVVPEPRLYIMSTTNRDTINNQNGNGIWQPGETIEILPIVKNYWGPTDDVRLGIEFAEFEDQTKATITQNEIQIGSISAYTTLQNIEESLKITISDNVANNVDITFNIKIWSGPDQEYISEGYEFVLNVTNTNLITGHYEDQVLTLEEDSHYLVVGPNVWENTQIIIEPGVLLEFDDPVTVLMIGNTFIKANGTPEKMITIKPKNSLPLGVPLGSTSYLSFSPSEFSENPEAENAGYQTAINQALEQGIERFLSTYDYVKFDNILYGGGSGSSNGPVLLRNCIITGLSSFRYAPNNIYRSNIIATHSIGWNDTFLGGAFYAIDEDGVNRLSHLPSYNNLTGKAPYAQFAGLNVAANNAIWYNQNIGDVLSPHDLIGVSATSVNQVIGIASGTDTLNNQFRGVSTIEKFKTIFLDATVGAGQGLFDWENSFVRLEPYEEAHAIVWKVLVNDKNAFDEYDLMEPIGVGPHEFKVYFNREMDTSVDPRISYGVIYPYSQKLIEEEGSWSSDGKIYTVTHDVNIGAADGINRIRITQARDLELFEIPVENIRFSMLIQSGGSASTGFFAEGGLGKIDLEWVAPSSDVLDDALGYNMYRYQVDANGVESDLVKLNESLIVEDTDESTTGVYYSDFNVVEGQTYFYKYKILRTSFEETDFSQTVSSAPLTSTLGDSNGDGYVNVMDLVQDVDYINGNNPSPFIFVAADVNNDETINVLDIVGTVELMQNPGGESGRQPTGSINYFSNNSIGDAVFTWEGNDLYVTSDFDIGGIQLAFDKDFIYSISDDLSNIERLDYLQDNAKVIMLYSFNNNIIVNTKTKILTRSDQESEFDIENAVVGTTQGDKLNAILNKESLESIESPFQSDQLTLLNMYPNPASQFVNLDFYSPELMEATVVNIYDIQERLVWRRNINNNKGIIKEELNLSKLTSGNYILTISGYKNGSVKHLTHKKLLIK